MTAVRDDAVVVGAGTAGSAAAWHLARRGLRVALVERRALESAGARCVVDVPAWLFDLAGVPRPVPPEVRADQPPLALVGQRPEHALVFDPCPTLPVDGPRLVARLQALALEAGVEAYPDAALGGLDHRHGRPFALEVRRDGARQALRLEAALFVDASGQAGALRRRAPQVERRCPPLLGAELCTAVRHTCEVADRAGAEAWLEAIGLEGHHVLCWNGLGVGFSTRLVHVSPDRSLVEVLHGGAHHDRSDLGPALHRQFLRAHPWIGRRVSGGAASIPVRRPYDTLAGPGVALVGDAGCQVFPAHGSGVGAGLVAARLLADAVAGAADPGAESVTWAYQAAFMRGRGAVHAAWDVFRRFTVELDGAEADRLLASGGMPTGVTRDGLEQRLRVPRPGDAPGVARAVPFVPGLLLRFGRLLPRFPAAFAAYKAFPRRPGELRHRAWARAAAAALGVRPDYLRS